MGASDGTGGVLSALYRPMSGDVVGCLVGNVGAGGWWSTDPSLGERKVGDIWRGSDDVGERKRSDRVIGNRRDE